MKRRCSVAPQDGGRRESKVYLSSFSRYAKNILKSTEDNIRKNIKWNPDFHLWKCRQLAIHNQTMLRVSTTQYWEILYFLYIWSVLLYTCTLIGLLCSKFQLNAHTTSAPVCRKIPNNAKQKLHVEYIYIHNIKL